MAGPPRMSTSAMFLSGLLLIVLAGVIAIGFDGPGQFRTVLTWLSSTFQLMGAALVAVSIGIKRLSRT
ncbi:MAG: hypothetical protein Q4F67_09440 [Propionibacteriaceae bacterium]|nr:hypothetical protein [Propionibacteriaceae bacterium]